MFLRRGLIKKSSYFYYFILIYFIGCAPGNAASVYSGREAIAQLKQAYHQQRSGFWVETEGKVIRLLGDDLEGARHQRFIIDLASGQTLLIAHNIDIAPRINNISINDYVVVHGEYEWNDKGGVIHWTHRNPSGRRPGGFIEHNGRRYQ